MDVNLDKDALASAADHQARSRFWAKVKKTPDCWIYSGAQSGGYGSFRLAGKSHTAHRVAKLWAEEIESTPLFALHKCNVKICVRPSHIYFGTTKQNTQDAIDAGVFPSATGELCAWSKMKESTAREILLKYRSSDQSASQLAACYGVSVHAIHALVLGQNWKHVNKNSKARLTKEESWDKRAHGERSPFSKLKAKDIPVICSMLRDGDSICKIAKFFGVSAPAICRIANGTGWKKELLKLGHTVSLRETKRRPLRISQIDACTRQKAVDLRASGCSYASISQRLGITIRAANALANGADKAQW